MSEQQTTATNDGAGPGAPMSTDHLAAIEHATPIVQTSGDVPTTTSMRVANGTRNEHRAVLQLIRDNIADFEEFGRVAFEMQPFSTPGGVQQRSVAILNEDHATLLLTYMRNNDVVRDFKKRLVREFSALRRKAAVQPAFDPDGLTRFEILTMALNAETERRALEAKTLELEPKAEAYDTFLDATGKYNVGAVAKMLGKSQNWLFRELRNRGVFIAKGAMRNTPYQQYMRYFEVKAHDYERTNGETGCGYTTYVQPSGIDFIRKRLGLQTIDPLPLAAGEA